MASACSPVLDRQLLPAAVEVSRAVNLRLLPGGRKQRVQVPVFLGLEGLDLLFPVHDQPHSHALHTAGGKPPAHLAPEEGAQLIAHQTVQHPAGLLGVEQVGIDDAGMGHALLHAFFGDFPEGDPVGGVQRQAQNVGQMPADGFPLPVRVGGQEHFVRLFGGGFQFLDELFLALDADILGCVVMLHINAHLTGGQVPDVAHAGGHFIAVAQVFADGLGLGGRLHNDKALP